MDSLIAAGPWTAVDRLLETEDEDALEAALAGADPAVAARAVSAAPTLQRKTDLLWAMEDAQRREALELVPPALIAALVQNLEDDNRYLLGDLSLEQFRAVLSLCSAERKYYWLVTALSFTDARANLLPLLLTTRELVEILNTRAEFGEHLRAIGDYPLESQRLPPDALADPAQALLDLVGPDDFLRVFPVPDETLASLLRTVLDYDADRYVDLIRDGLRLLDYAENHPEEWETLTETPVLLDYLEPIPVLREPEALPPLPALEDGPPVALAPLPRTPLARVAGALPPAQQRRVLGELHELVVRQAVAEGGSFQLGDLERTARGVAATLLLGLEAESAGRAEVQPRLLEGRPLHRISHSGARLVERLRQPALRLAPLEAVLSARERAVVRSLASPRLTVSPEGDPRLILYPAPGLPESVTLREAAELLQEVGTWTEIARTLGMERTAALLRAAGTVHALLEDLALSGVLYARLEPGLAVAGDRESFQRRYAEPGGALLPEAAAALRRAVEAWPEGRELRQAALPLLEAALRRLAG